MILLQQLETNLKDKAEKEKYKIKVNEMKKTANEMKKAANEMEKTAQEKNKLMARIAADLASIQGKLKARYLIGWFAS